MHLSLPRKSMRHSNIFFLVIKLNQLFIMIGKVKDIELIEKMVNMIDIVEQ